jgi:hypothetical protein
MVVTCKKKLGALWDIFGIQLQPRGAHGCLKKDKKTMSRPMVPVGTPASTFWRIVTNAERTTWRFEETTPEAYAERTAGGGGRGVFVRTFPAAPAGIEAFVVAPARGAARCRDYFVVARPGVRQPNGEALVHALLLHDEAGPCAAYGPTVAPDDEPRRPPERRPAAPRWTKEEPRWASNAPSPNAPPDAPAPRPALPGPYTRGPALFHPKRPRH